MEATTMEAVYNQAILFFALFGGMFIISFFVTKRNAKKYVENNSLEKRRESARKEKLVNTFLNSSTIKIVGKKATLEELTYKLEKGDINKQEYTILEETLKAS
ncbi:hypothetical protein [Sulfurimonas sp. CS5]|uniref:hypothetical protein n=1 Tax=Sulfurimonas sp. CS5 TaxID=3391145 RepID=UPI0039E9F702